MIVEGPSGERFIIVRLGETEREISVQMAALAYDNNSGNTTHAARALGLNRTCLSMRMRSKDFGDEVRQVADKWGLVVPRHPENDPR